MPRRVTPRTTLEQLKRDAKRWLHALREHDEDARARLARALPGAPDAPTLRDVQLALARELGFPGWTALKAHLAASVGEHDDGAALVARFLDNACPDHHVRGIPDHVRARSTAMRLLERHPGLARATFQTAVVCGDLATVERMLAERPELATMADGVPSAERAGGGGSGDLLRRDLGVKGWQPLLYLCFTRLPLAAVSENALAIARALLDHGADPNAYFMAGDSRYTPLVGAIGEGEENRPPHPQRDALVQLLLDRGAEPYDQQVVYDIHFHGRVLWFLEAIHARSLALGREGDWRDPSWAMLDMGGYGNGARWHLGIAIARGDVALARWCLDHGADPNAPPPRAKQLPQGTLYDEARRRGELEIAKLLLEHGARPSNEPLEGVEAFEAACFSLDRAEAARLAGAHPEFLREARLAIHAASNDRADVLGLLLDLGMSPDIETQQHERPLHSAAYKGALRAAALLVERGAEVDPYMPAWGATPIGAAIFGGRTAMVDYLAPLSHDIWELAFAGRTERLRELLRESPERARATWERQTPLMWLPPDDEDRAIEVAQLFLELGADPTVVNEDGMTAADRAERLGMSALAAVLSPQRGGNSKRGG